MPIDIYYELVANWAWVLFLRFPNLRVLLLRFLRFPTLRLNYGGRCCQKCWGSLMETCLGGICGGRHFWVLIFLNLSLLQRCFQWVGLFLPFLVATRVFEKDGRSDSISVVSPAWHSVMSILSGPVQRPTDCGEYGFQEDGPAPFEDSELEQVIKDARVWLKTDTQKTYEKFIKSDEFLMDLLLSASFLDPRFKKLSRSCNPRSTAAFPRIIPVEPPSRIIGGIIKKRNTAHGKDKFKLQRSLIGFQRLLFDVQVLQLFQASRASEAASATVPCISTGFCCRTDLLLTWASWELYLFALVFGGALAQLSKLILIRFSGAWRLTSPLTVCR